MMEARIVLDNGLPYLVLDHDKGSSVYAFRSDYKAWFPIDAEARDSMRDFLRDQVLNGS